MNIQNTAAKARITAIGTYVPERRLTNFELEQMVDTSDEWIVQRTGIRERRIAGPDEYTSDLCVAAVKDLTERYGKSVADVDFIIAATTTPDYPFPSVSSQVQARCGIEQAGAIDISAACAGFTYGLHLASGLIASGLHKKILVIGGETLSKVTDYHDRTTCILFGDGAGAVLVERDEEVSGFLAAHVGSKGEGGVHLYRSGLSKQMGEKELAGNGCIVQNGREVYRWATTTVPVGMRQVMEKSSLQLSDVDWFIPHSANLRMVESICEKSGFPMEQALYSMELYGNTSSASIPLALDKGLKDGKVKTGDVLLLYGFGGGLVHAGLLLRWTI
ncbi:ketoacyl-ACP synthase III [Brevibacillus sp. B_LB10_24]|uniref:ketoacyl-ACP synthase III n=1 Tax=Brevibacillus sp. B_LB10_24 TaxID=3380645 RepID=UPI0038BAD816